MSISRIVGRGVYVQGNDIDNGGIDRDLFENGSFDACDKKRMSRWELHKPPSQVKKLRVSP